MTKKFYNKLLKKDKDSILRKINNYHTKTFDLSKINQELIFNNKDVCLAIIENNLFNLIFDNPEYFYQCLSNELKQNPQIVIHMFTYVDIDFEMLIKWNEDLRNNQDVINQLLHRDQTICNIEYAGKKLLENEDFVINAIQNCHYFNPNNLPDILLKNKNIVVAAFEKCVAYNNLEGFKTFQLQEKLLKILYKELGKKTVNEILKTLSNNTII